IVKYYVIPKILELDKYLSLSKEYSLGFEYNEFFMPDILDDEKKLNDIINKYSSLNRKNDTLHGVFFDIVLDSKDNLIKNISYQRVRKSLEIASKLKCKGVVFHTNYITWMKDINYKERWIKLNTEAYLKLIEEFKDLEIYIENMFDLDPYMLRDLVKNINHERIGVCLDIAHASISNMDLDIWFKELSPYIKHIHINDNDKIIDSHEELGKGKIDYKKAYEYINKLNDNTSILIEISDYNKTYNSIKYLKDGGFDDFK
ncbi:MAG: sugar phosphate isomerase/epimerase, partial [Acholeplasmatales bacterium]|nr:sugar phosphate isomerase/epimerase [Acholeplasmatales bacterium]